MNTKLQLIVGILLVALVAPTVFAENFGVLSVTYSPAPATPGQLITLYSTIKNITNADSGEISVTIKPEYPFLLSPAGKSEQRFPTVLSQQTALAVLELEVDSGALNGTYTVELQIKKGEQVILGRPIEIKVLTQKPQVEIIGSNTTIAAPGEIVENQLTIKNVGSSTARNIFIGTSDDRTVTSTGIVIDRPIKNVGTSLLYVETLEPNQTKELVFRLSVDSTAEQKTHSVPIKIKFQDNNRTDYEITRSIGIRVRGTAEIDADISQETGAKLFPGGTGKLSVNLFNRGTATARNLVVTIQDTPQFDFQNEKKVFIGTLDPDDFDSFALDVFTKPETLPGTYPVKALFEYKSQDFETITQEKTLEFQVHTQAQATGKQSSVFDWLLPLVVIAVIGYLAYQRFFAKKTKK